MRHGCKKMNKIIILVTVTVFVLFGYFVVAWSAGWMLHVGAVFTPSECLQLGILYAAKCGQLDFIPLGFSLWILTTVYMSLIFGYIFAKEMIAQNEREKNRKDLLSENPVKIFGV